MGTILLSTPTLVYPGDEKEGRLADEQMDSKGNKGFLPPSKELRMSEVDLVDLGEGRENYCILCQLA